MKKFKTFVSFVLLILVATTGFLVGCGDKYRNMKVTTDVEESLTLYLGEDTENTILSSASFK